MQVGNSSAEEMVAQVKHILKHQHFNFVRTLLVIDSGDELPPTFVVAWS